MSKTKVVIIVVVILTILISSSFLLILRRQPKSEESPPPQVGEFLFIDTYEDSPTITETTHDLWTQVIADTKKGNYWADEVHWLENAKSAEKSYAIDPEMGQATITSSTAHNGTRSVMMDVSAVPPDYTYSSCLLARYIRNQSLIVDAVYEVGAWFYVPAGNVPVIVFGMENHPSWVTQYFAYAGIETENGTVFAMDDNLRIPVGSVNFQHDTWFKLWITWDLRAQNFTLNYKSPTEEKTFQVDWTWKSGGNLAYIGYKAFNFYAGAGNLQSAKSQKFYVDDFYAKVVSG